MYLPGTADLLVRLGCPSVGVSTEPGQTQDSHYYALAERCSHRPVLGRADLSSPEMPVWRVSRVRKLAGRLRRSLLHAALPYRGGASAWAPCLATTACQVLFYGLARERAYGQSFCPGL